MFDFTHLNSFNKVINLTINYLHDSHLEPEVLNTLSNIDFEKFDITINSLHEQFKGVDLKVIEEINYNIISIEGESKAYLYAQNLYKAIDISKELCYKVHSEYCVRDFIAKSEIERWRMYNEQKPIPDDFYLKIFINANRNVRILYEYIFNVFQKIELHFKSTYWYVRYPEKFGGKSDSIGYAPIVYQPSASDSLKLKWNCQPAVLGYLICELVRAGFIDPPTTNGELSWAKLGTLCHQIFDVRSKDGNPTTVDYWKKIVNPESNQLPDYKRIKLTLPDLDDL